MVAGIIVAAGLFALWCFISLSYVPALKLKESTIPYIYVARAVAGPTGIVLMGVALLAGALAAANALLLGVPLAAASLPARGWLAVMLRSRVRLLLLLGGGIALVMGLGFGGSSYLPLYLKASALLWLLSYALHHLSSPGPRGQPAGESRAGGILGSLLLTGAAALALVTDREWPILAAYMILVVGGLALLGSIPRETGRESSRVT